MEISQEAISKYKIKKVLKISVFILLLFVIGLLIFEYIRITPRNVYFSNITSSSVTVSWNTKSPTSATVIPFEGNSILPIRLLCLFKEKFFDTRDVVLAEKQAAANAGMNREGFSLTINNFQTEIVVKDKGKYFTHHITINGLDSEKEYSFMIGDSLLYRAVKDINDSRTAKTLTVPEELKSPYPAYGLVKNAENIFDGSIEDLNIISDGIIYFNYLDEKTKEKSNLFSSSLGNNGAWYVDVSGAIDKEGKNFLETHSTIDNDIVVELTLDAGQSGLWKSKRPDEVMTPAQPFIINLPNSVQDENEIDSVIRVQSYLQTLVKGVSASEPSDCEQEACQFINFCGPCQKKCSDGKWYPCNCNNDTLIKRQCNKDPDDPETPLPLPTENPPQCAGGYDIGESIKYGSNCLVCSKRPSGTYYIAAWETDNKNFDINKNCTKITQCNPKTCAQASNGNYVHESPPAKPYDTKDFDNGCGINIPCYKTVQTTCIPKTCAQASNGNYVHESPPAKPYDTKDFDNGCGKNIPCYKTVQTTCIPYDCSTASHGEYPLEENAKYSSDPENYNKITIGVGCEKTKNCYRSICKPKLCSELANNEGYDLDSPPENVDSSSIRITDNCGKIKLCYYEPDPNYSKWEESPETIAAKKTYENLATKKACPNEDSVGNKISLCTCSDTTIDSYVYPGEYCRQSKSTFQEDGILYCTGYEEGMVCEKGANNTLFTCQESDDSVMLHCVMNSSKSSVPFKKSSLSALISILKKKISAETLGDGNFQYLIDSKTGLFVNLPIGIYLIENQGERYSIEIKKAGESVQTLLYIDKNENGEYNDGIDLNLSENASLLSISPLELTYTYHLREGFNFISFPFLLQISDTSTTAASLLQYLNKEYNNSIYSIAKYDSSWKIVGQNNVVYDSNDFQLIPGQGYVIKAKENLSITLQGQPVKFETTTDQAPVSIFPGWNLIGVYGTQVKQYSAKTMLQDINAYDKIDFTADLVNGWDQDSQAYEGFVLETENSIEREYGFDFPINTLKSYFVRVNNGSGNWEPKLAE